MPRKNYKIQSSAELKLAKDVKGNKKGFLCICLETVTSVSLDAVTTQQVCCGEAGSRSSWEIKSAGQDQSQDQGGTRLGTDTAAAQLQCASSRGQAQEPQLESSSQGTERQAGPCWGCLQLFPHKWFRSAKRLTLNLANYSPEPTKILEGPLKALMQYRLGIYCPESSIAEQNLGDLVENELNVRQQHALAAKKGWWPSRLY